MTNKIQINKAIGYFHNGESINHQVSQNPRKPDYFDKGLYQYQLDKWVEDHEKGVVRDAVRAVVEKTKCVFFEDFKKAVINSALFVNRIINEDKLPYETLFSIIQDKKMAELIAEFADFPRKSSSKNRLISFVEGKKSNKWVAEIALHAGLRSKFYYRPGVKQAQAFAGYIESIKNNQSKMEKFKKKMKGKTFAIYDDGSYSGRQLAEHVKGMKNLISEHELEPKRVVIVCPYMTRHAENLLTNEMGKHEGVDFLLSEHKIMTTIIDDVDEEHHETLKNMWFKKEPDRLKKVALQFFQHKVPNSESFPKAMVSGSIYDENGNSNQTAKPFIPKIIPPYKKN